MWLPLPPAHNPDPQIPSKSVTYFLVHQLLTWGGVSLTWKTLLQRQTATLGFPWHLAQLYVLSPRAGTINCSFQTHLWFWWMEHHRVSFQGDIQTHLFTPDREDTNRLKKGFHPHPVWQTSWVLLGYWQEGAWQILRQLHHCQGPLHLKSGSATSSAAVSARPASVLMYSCGICPTPSERKAGVLYRWSGSSRQGSHPA